MIGKEHAAATSGFLNDADLLELLRKNLITGCRSDATNDWKGDRSQIQASSIDLYPCAFYTPNIGDDKPRATVSLSAGQAVVIYTKEEFALPSDVMGFIFTPTSLSLAGFFSPSLGHIDPGFKGRLRMVGINMGKDPLRLNHSTKVATVVLCKLHAPSAADYTQRGRKIPHMEHEAAIISSRLASDFGDFREQARRVAKDITTGQYWGTMLQVVVGGLLIFLLAALLNAATYYLSDITSLKDRVSHLEGAVSVIGGQQKPAQAFPGREQK